MCRPAVNGRKSVLLQLESSGSPAYERAEEKTRSAGFEKTHSREDGGCAQGSPPPSEAPLVTRLLGSDRIRAAKPEQEMRVDWSGAKISKR